VSVAATRVSGVLRDYRSDELIKNSFFLLLSTATQGILGAAFWLLSARLFNAAEIGEATALISATVLLGYVSLLGLNSSVIRFLPTTRDGDAHIDNGIAIPLVVAAVLATSYVLVLPSLASQLAFVRHSLLDASGFVVFTAMTALVLFTDAVFIARRQAKYNLLVDGLVLGGTKLALPVALVGAGAFGIVAANGFAALLDVAVSVVLMVVVLGYRPSARVHLHAIREALAFSSANYLANLLNLLPTLVLPLAILDELGARAAGFYYIAFSIANMLNATAYSTCQSLFAEGSHGGTDKIALTRRSAVLLAAITVPTAALFAALSHIVLSLFGEQYSLHGTGTLVVLALALIPVSACSWTTTLLRINGQLGALMLSTTLYAVSICTLAVWWARSGLVFVALAWMTGNIVATLVAGAALWRGRNLFLAEPAAV
jgi:O-antigen/teichoic acid export membrane protein